MNTAGKKNKLAKSEIERETLQETLSRDGASKKESVEQRREVFKGWRLEKGLVV